METYRFENINYVYNGYDKSVLSDVTFEIEKGDFIVVCGPSGSGKTTLLKWLKENNSSFGYVMQEPSAQIVTDTVYHELAFGMENNGAKPDEMKQKIAELSTYFGLEKILHRTTADLSGGEKQLVNLASVLAMEPDVILLDEPTAQLDPMAATEFLDIIKRINSQFGITIILVEQRLEDVLSVCDKMLLIADGRAVALNTVSKVFETIVENGISKDFLPYLPSYIRLYNRFSKEKTNCPKNVKECKKWFRDNAIELKTAENDKDVREIVPGIVCKNLFFRYEKKEKDILKDISISLYSGQITGIVGSNGSGKSTFLKILAGLKKCYHGKSTVCGKVLYLPQEPKYMFLEETIGEIVQDLKTAQRFGLEKLLRHHPYDVSGGQMQRLAMAYLYQKDADIYLFDEPTKGLDPKWKYQFECWLKELKEKNKTVVIVSHDVEFAANCCDYMAMCFDGSISEPICTEQFLSKKYFYTTAIHKIVRDRYPSIVSERCLYER